MMGDPMAGFGSFIFPFKQFCAFQTLILIVRPTEITRYPPTEINNTRLSGDGSLF